MQQGACSVWSCPIRDLTVWCYSPQPRGILSLSSSLTVILFSFPITDYFILFSDMYFLNLAPKPLPHSPELSLFFCSQPILSKFVCITLAETENSHTLTLKRCNAACEGEISLTCPMQTGYSGNTIYNALQSMFIILYSLMPIQLIYHIFFLLNIHINRLFGIFFFFLREVLNWIWQLWELEMSFREFSQGSRSLKWLKMIYKTCHILLWEFSQYHKVKHLMIAGRLGSSAKSFTYLDRLMQVDESISQSASTQSSWWKYILENGACHQSTVCCWWVWVVP